MTKTLLLASTAIVAWTTFGPAPAEERPLIMAQAAIGGQQQDNSKKPVTPPPTKQPTVTTPPPKQPTVQQQQLHIQQQGQSQPKVEERKVIPPTKPTVTVTPPPKLDQNKVEERKIIPPKQPTVTLPKTDKGTLPTVTTQQQQLQKNKNVTLPTITAAPIKPHNANEFIRKNNAGPAPTLTDLKKQRTETKQGNNVLIHEGDRTIVKQDNRVFIRHDENQRFAIGARHVDTKNVGDRRLTTIEKANGARIITTTDRNGRILRRVRRDRNGHETVLIESFAAGLAAGLFLSLAPPVVHIPRDRYIVEAWRASPEQIYDTFEEPPVEEIDQPYTVDQVLYNAPLRDRMPRVDLDVNFDTGSWQLTPDQVDTLAAIADAIKRAIDRNPREIFLIEGFTDAVGSEEDNLSLSDRRAEAVAVALTEQFGVPPENLVTQGYGEQFLKVPTQGPERSNRRVAIQRITPLIDQGAR